MDFLELNKQRRSIRDYSDKPIPHDVLEKIVDAARFAPTARGVEPWEFIVITAPEKLKKIAELAENGRFIAQAKACIAVFCRDTKYYLEDGCAATQNLLLAATALKVGSCWVAGDKKPYASLIASLLNLPPAVKLVSLVALGYPKYAGSSFRLIDKRPLKDVLHWESF
jgi:nitroreductase